MGERIPCEHSKTIPCDRCKAAPGGCAEFAELTPEDAERYLPREGQDNLIVPKSCPIPPLTSVIRYGPDYYVLKKGRVLRTGFARSLPSY
jgi:hypothetical protein